MTAATASRLTTLLGNDQLAHVERMRILTGRRFTNRSRGEHRSRGGGRSLEFKDYRDYAVGDDTRFVDWNIFARLRRPYVKLFHAEEELHLVLLVDASTSMRFEGKLESARRLAAAFGVMGLLGGERVSVHAFTGRGEGTAALTAPRGRKGMAPLFRFVEAIEGGGDAPLEEGVEMMCRTHRGRGALIVLSDFLSFGDPVDALNRAYGRGLEIFGLQILAPSELRPELDADLQLVDAETAATLDVTAGDDLLAIYHEHREALQRHVERLCRRRGGRHLVVDSSDPIDRVLFEQLPREGWVR